MQQKVFTFLMFTGEAEEAMNFYTSLFDQSEILSLVRYGVNEAGREGTVFHATFSIKGQRIMCIDSPPVHGFTFTPAISIYVACDTETEIDHAFERLAQGGIVLMPLSTYPFSKRYGWVQDRYGVSWQLSLEDGVSAG
jgi:predicted 3-demethylubiquinone-9 3-methyltransferase (glyoxalase superfamily)